MSTIAHITLENFTAFAVLDHSLSPGVNVIIGANGTGKTHLLKVLYAACAVTVGEDRDKGFALKLRNVFNPFEGRMGRLARRLTTSVTTRGVVTLTGRAKKLSFEFSNHTVLPDRVTVTGESAWKKNTLTSAYIPVKEMLAHAPGFLATTANREIAFEEIYPDILKRAYLPKLMGPPDKNRQRLLTALQESIEGKVVTRGEHFFLKNQQGNLEFTLLAEGMRKLALVWLLIQNGTLQSGSVLFWDEPEANLNPALMGKVVEVILELHRQGVQVFLTTHNYVLLKEFDLRLQHGDQIHYMSLCRDDSGAVSANGGESYLDLNPNAIADTFDALYDREISRSLGGVRP
ncbi:MAG: AAA family ATPase [Magnetococcales bacterium]|nr:AAA family ATPase [Magnetococcales bacterium]